MKKLIVNKENPNGLLVDLTAEEISQRETDIAKIQAEAQAKAEAEAQAQAQKEAEETAKATAQSSGNQKLLDLGLTQAEATALTGYTPPSEE
jgi:membrane protein involved in colicin uptake